MTGDPNARARSATRPWIERRAARRLSLVWLCLGFAISAARAGDQAQVPIGGTLPHAALHGLNGPSKTLDSFRGRPLIINVWASWCGPCRQEMASLERLAWHEQAQNFAIIGVSTDDDAAQAAAMLKNINATISQFIDRDLEMENMLGASRLPLTVLVAADGRVLERIYGAREWDSRDSIKLIEEAFRGSRAAH